MRFQLMLSTCVYGLWLINFLCWLPYYFVFFTFAEMLYKYTNLLNTETRWSVLRWDNVKLGKQQQQHTDQYCRHMAILPWQRTERCVIKQEQSKPLQERNRKRYHIASVESELLLCSTMASLAQEEIK